MPGSGKQFGQESKAKHKILTKQARNEKKRGNPDLEAVLAELKPTETISPTFVNTLNEYFSYYIVNWSKLTGKEKFKVAAIALGTIALGSIAAVVLYNMWATELKADKISSITPVSGPMSSHNRNEPIAPISTYTKTEKPFTTTVSPSITATGLTRKQRRQQQQQMSQAVKQALTANIAQSDITETPAASSPAKSVTETSSVASVSQRTTTATDLPSLEEIQTILNDRPTEYLVAVPEGLPVTLPGDPPGFLVNFTKIVDSLTVNGLSLQSIALSTNFNALWIAPGTTFIDGSWARISTNSTYAPDVSYSGVTLEQFAIKGSYIPNMQFIVNAGTVSNDQYIGTSYADGLTTRGNFSLLWIADTQMQGADLSQTSMSGVTFINIDMPGSLFNGTSFGPHHSTLQPDFPTLFSVVNADNSTVCALVLQEVTAFGAGSDKGLSLNGAVSCPEVPMSITQSQSGISISLRDTHLPSGTRIDNNALGQLDLSHTTVEAGATITDNTFSQLDLEGTTIASDATVTGNTANRNDVSTQGYTFFGNTTFAADSATGNDFGKSYCNPQSSTCDSLPLPITCLDTDSSFYQHNSLEATCRPTLPTHSTETTTPTQTATSTIPTNTQSTTKPTGSKSSGLSGTNLALIVGVSSAGAVLLCAIIAGICTAKRKQSNKAEGQHRSSLFNQPSIQSLDEQTPLSPQRFNSSSRVY